jgi:hypothetical protein
MFSSCWPWQCRRHMRTRFCPLDLLMLPLSFCKMLDLRCVGLWAFSNSSMCQKVLWSLFSPHLLCEAIFVDSLKNSQEAPSFHIMQQSQQSCIFLRWGGHPLGIIYSDLWSQYTSATFHSFLDHHHICKPLGVSYFLDKIWFKQSLDLSLRCSYLLFWHFMKLLLSGLCNWTYLQSVLNDLPAYSNEVGGWPCKNIAILSRNASSSDYSSEVISMPMQAALLGTLGSNATFLISPSTSMVFLNSTRAYVLMEQADCWYCSNSSLTKWMFLWPGAKPCSMFLTSFGLPKTDMILKVADTFRQRYPECRATSNVVIYSVLGFRGVLNDMGRVITLTGSILLPLKPYKCSVGSFNCFRS